MVVTRRLVSLLALACPAWASGCYTYAVVPAERLAPGEDVRVVLAGSPLADAGVPGASVEGELLSREEGALMLYVPAGTRQVGFHSEVLSQRVRIAEASVLVLERRELDRGRTALLLGGLGLGVGALAWKALGGEAGGQTTNPPGDGTSAAVLPLVRVRLPLLPRIR